MFRFNEKIKDCSVPLKFFNIILSILIFILLATLYSPADATAEESPWKFGIGTNLFWLNIDGTQGLHLNQIDTSVDFDIDMSASDVNDIIDTALGFGGYVSYGKLFLDYSVQYLKLEDGESYSGGPLSRFDLEFETSGLQIMVGYPVLRHPNVRFLVHGGIRYTSHKMNSSLVYNGATFRKNLDNDWLDGLIGISAVVPLSQTVNWISRFNAGYGGSDGTYQFSSGLFWRFHKHWETCIFGRYTAVNFEKGSRGDADWYLYDVDEYGLGLGIIYHF